MQRKMLINAQDADEMRVAVVEDGRLEGFFAETAAKERTRGNIYKGVVSNVEPSLEAAFIDFGQPKNGFLQVNDVRPEAYHSSVKDEGGHVPIQKALKRGQDIIVQVVKEAAGTKGASLTTYISLPGQSLVLTPGRDKRGVSRKIAKDTERKRLKDTLSGLKLPPGFGIIARTAAEGRSKKDILAEGRQLFRLWQDILKQAKQLPLRSLVHKESELALRAVRDFFTSDLTEILVDDPEVYSRVQRFVSLVNPRRKGAVKPYREMRPIFSKYDIEEQLKSVFLPRVELPSGGSLIINPTEALVAVDVNSGKAISGSQIEQTALNVNLEAAAEVARQLRLRDLGGLVVIDFIDMRERKNQRTLVKKLKDELKKDKAKVTVGSISRFGLMEMSRQRLRSPVDFGQSGICPRCQGRGVVRSAESLGRAALRTLELRLRKPDAPGYRVLVPPDVAHYLQNLKRSELSRLEAEAEVCLEVVSDHELAAEAVMVESLSEAWVLPCAESGAAAKPAKPVPPVPPVPPAPQPPQAPAKAEADKPKKETKSRRPRRRPRRKPAKPAGTNESGQKQAAPNGQSKPSSPKPDGPNAKPSAPNAKPDGPNAKPDGNKAKQEQGSGQKEAPAKKSSSRRRRGRRRSGAARRRAKKAAEAAQKATGASSGGSGEPSPSDSSNQD